jgi:hypothetical protein
MEEIFDIIQTPSFDSNYVSELNAMVDAINSNFKRIASLPFLKGDKGTSIEYIEEPIYITSNSNNVFSDFGISVIGAIYGKDVYDYLNGLTNATFENLTDKLRTIYDDAEPMNIGPMQDIYSCNSLHPDNNPKIGVFYDPHNGIKHLCVPYTFHDARKTILDLEYKPNFIDQTTFITGKYTPEEKWQLKSENLIPGLYFDNDININKYCWAIGNRKTHIIAQGVNGQNGQDCKAFLCKGNWDQENNCINITSVFDTSSRTYNEDLLSSLYDGAFAIVILHSDADVPVDIAFGAVYVMDDNYYLFINSGDVDDVGSSLGNNVKYLLSGISLNDALQDIGYDTTNSSTRGLYTYSMSEATANGVERIPNMIWVDYDETNNTQKNINISPVKNVSSAIKSPDKIKGDNCLINYDNLKISDYAGIFNRKLETSISIPQNSKYVLIPSTNISVNNFKNTSVIQSINKQSFKNADNIEILVELPHIGVKLENEVIALNKFSRMYGNINSPISINLKLEELNCNWNTDDNSSWGGRSYYDVDLFASSATFNENKSQAVYVGTTEVPIHAKINDGDFKAVLQITAIRYDVAFDDKDRPLNVHGYYTKANANNNNTCDLVDDSDMLYNAIQNGETNKNIKDKDGVVKFSSKISCNSIKTYTEFIYYIKPFDTSDYNVFRFRTIEDQNGNLVIDSYKEDEKREVFDLNKVSEYLNDNIIKLEKFGLDYIEINGIKYVIHTERGQNKKYIYYTDGEYTNIKCYINIETTASGRFVNKIYTKNEIDYEIDYEIGDNLNLITKLKNYVSIENNDRKVINFPANQVVNLKDELKDDNTVYCVKHNVNDDDLSNYRYIKININSLEAEVYFADTHKNNKTYEIKNDSSNEVIGLNNTKYYQVLKSKNVSANNNRFFPTVSIDVLNNGAAGATNKYSIKFNGYSWVNGVPFTFNPYISGIGCGKILPRPDNGSNSQTQPAAKEVDYKWVLALPKFVNNKIDINYYKELMLNKTNTTESIKNYKKIKLPSDEYCHYFDTWYLNDSEIVTVNNINSTIHNSNNNNQDTTIDDNTNHEFQPVLPENPGVANPA